jgi:hypothetical protein
VEKFEAILKLCEEIGVETKPRRVRGVYVVPLFGWYSPNFDPSFNGDPKYQKGWLDFRKCRWPSEIAEDVEGPAKYFTSLNNMDNYEAPVVSFSQNARFPFLYCLKQNQIVQSKVQITSWFSSSANPIFFAANFFAFFEKAPLEPTAMGIEYRVIPANLLFGFTNLNSNLNRLPCALSPVQQPECH